MFQEALSDRGREIFPALKNFDDFYLAGGTALALQIGHRISVDFDLFSEAEISKNLLNEAKKIFSGKSVVVSVNNPDELTVFVDGTKVTFLKYPFPVLYDFIDYEGIKMLNIKELAVTKAYTIGRRGSYKDYVDLYFVLKENHSSLAEIMELAEKKYKKEFNSRLLLEQLVYFEDIEDTKIIFLKERADKKELEKFFENEIKKVKL